MEGSFADIQKKLEANPKTNIPQILFTVYQHVFNSIYILASILNTPYPPPDLLHPMAEKIQILSSTPKPQPQPKQAATPEQTSTPETPPMKTAPAPATETDTQQPTSEQPSSSEQAGQTQAPTTGGNAQTTSNPPPP